VTGKNGTIKVSAGTLTNPSASNYTVTGIPNATNLKITDSLSAVCKFDTTITGPNCNCTPKDPIVLTPSVTVCAGDTFPTLKATVVGLAVAEWFTQPTGGSMVFSGPNYKPAGTVPAIGDTVYVQARSTDASCPTVVTPTRVPVFINAQNCNVEIDLALKKLISKKLAAVNDVITYTIKVWNESSNPATGVEVTDMLNAGVQYISSSSKRLSNNTTAGTYNSATGIWTIGNMAANGDTVALEIQVKVLSEGLWFNTAEISKTNEKDKDSTPGNKVEGEDDIDRQCFTVPIKLCPTQKIEATIPSTYTGVKWFKGGQEITALAGQNTVLLSDAGTYTYTATNGTCPAEGCCPIIIQPGDNCCPVQICVPFTVTKKKK
jgi:uncharacterized repeat protein (TIGR01451 family)